MKYTEYIKTQAWLQRKKQREELDGHKCQMCGSYGTQNNPLQCHHFSYKNLGHEDIENDIVTLCKACHKSVHCMMNRRTSNGRGWKDSLSYSQYTTNENMIIHRFIE